MVAMRIASAAPALLTGPSHSNAAASWASAPLPAFSSDRANPHPAATGSHRATSAALIGDFVAAVSQ